MPTKCQNQAKAKRDGVINPQNYNFGLNSKIRLIAILGETSLNNSEHVSHE